MSDLDRQTCPICGRPDCGDPTTSCCFIHHEVEPLGADPYRVCFECGHVYQAPADLVAAYNAGAGQFNDHPPPPAPGAWEDVVRKLEPKEVGQVVGIVFCPACLHDF